MALSTSHQMQLQTKINSVFINGDVDKNEASFDGQRVAAAAGRYSLTLPTSNNSISFSSEVTSRNHYDPDLIQ